MYSSKKVFNKIENFCHKEANALGLKKIIATVSGGADSVAMLAAIYSTGIKTVAAHCNFHLRGEESNRDEEHVREICRQINVELLTIDFDVEDYISHQKGMSVEMACRELRHSWFASLLSDLKADRIATGHNADDNIETLFLNLMRGSGTSGLRGMLPDTGKIWRPLLSFHRHDILNYLTEKGLTYVTDSTNLESDYRRNYLRNEIIPLLRARWTGFDKALDRSISLLREENKLVVSCINESLPQENGPLNTDIIINFPDPELLIRRYIEPLGPFTTTASEVAAAIVADKPNIKKWKLRKGILRLQNHRLFLDK